MKISKKSARCGEPRYAFDMIGAIEIFQTFWVFKT